MSAVRSASQQRLNCHIEIEERTAAFLHAVRPGGLVGIHGVFLASLLAAVIADRLGDGTRPPEENSEARGGNAKA